MGLAQYYSDADKAKTLDDNIKTAKEKLEGIEQYFVGTTEEG